MVKAHAARMYAMYGPRGYLMRDSIGYTEYEVEEWAKEAYESTPVGCHILEITVTPHVDAALKQVAGEGTE